MSAASEREVLVALSLPFEHQEDAGDGRPAMRLRTPEEAADMVLAAGFHLTTPATPQDVLGATPAPSVSAERVAATVVAHFRNGLVPDDPRSMQHIANSNRAFGADCVLQALVGDLGLGYPEAGSEQVDDILRAANTEVTP